MKIITVFGTRPEAIKMAPLVQALLRSPQIECKVCITAQHREMLDMVLELFKIVPDYDLNLMKHGQSITDITVGVLEGMGPILEKEKPALVLVHGDTTTSAAASLACFYKKIPVGHVEAGLRSGNAYSPYPEEMNRRLTGTLATLHFAPTEGNKKNLLDCGIEPEKVFVTGNTVIDALQRVARADYFFSLPLLNTLDYNRKKVILLTAHRRENWGKPLRNIFLAVKEVLNNHNDTELIFPVHPNPLVQGPAREILGSLPGAHLIPPLDYAPFVNLMARAHLILTDSGGIQEEAPSLGKPVLVLRRETERQEAVAAGTVRMAGVERENIYRLTSELLTNELEYEKMSQAVNPYGDGKASHRILNILLERKDLF